MFIETLFANQCYYARSVRQICTYLGSVHTERLRQWQRQHCIAIHCGAWKSIPLHFHASQCIPIQVGTLAAMLALTLTFGVSILLDRKITITVITITVIIADVLLDLLSLLSHLCNP